VHHVKELENLISKTLSDVDLIINSKPNARNYIPKVEVTNIRGLPSAKTLSYWIPINLMSR
jgi:hypothetical protein